MSKFLRWIPAVIVMAVIFISSSTPSSNLPDYGIWDTLLKKCGHMSGYALLAVCYWYGFNFEGKRGPAAWLLALLYAVSDELHQSLTPGRHPSAMDVVLFDGGGAALGIILWRWFLRWKRQKAPVSAEKIA